MLNVPKIAKVALFKKSKITHYLELDINYEFHKVTPQCSFKDTPIKIK